MMSHRNQGIELEMLGFRVSGFSRDALELIKNIGSNFQRWGKPKSKRILSKQLLLYDNQKDML
jgi:hypothetical protein